MDQKKDLFICHASEDKASVVRPLVSSLAQRGRTSWLDETEISAGESITERVNNGLKVSDFVVVILSRAFMAKHWPKRELWAVLNLEAKSGKAIIIPVLVGTRDEIDGIIEEFPLLNDKLCLLWKGDANLAADAIHTAIQKSQGVSHPLRVQMHTCGCCSTPFQHGVHVCLGCQGTIKYGLTTEERRSIRQVTATVIGIFSLLSMIVLPAYSELWFGFKLPIMWGLGFAAFPIAAVGALGGAFFSEARISARKAHLIRTFR